MDGKGGEKEGRSAGRVYRRNSHGPRNDPAPRPRADGNFFLRGCFRVGAVRATGLIIASFLKQHAASVENVHRRRAAGLA